MSRTKKQAKASKPKAKAPIKAKPAPKTRKAKPKAKATKKPAKAKPVKAKAASKPMKAKPKASKPKVKPAKAKAPAKVAPKGKKPAPAPAPKPVRAKVVAIAVAAPPPKVASVPVKVRTRKPPVAPVDPRQLYAVVPRRRRAAPEVVEKMVARMEPPRSPFYVAPPVTYTILKTPSGSIHPYVSDWEARQLVKVAGHVLLGTVQAADSLEAHRHCMRLEAEAYPTMEQRAKLVMR